MSEFIPYIIGAVLLVGVFFFGRTTAPPSVIEVPVSGEVDENEWVSRASYVQQRDIADSLSSYVSELLTAKEANLRSFTRAQALLRLEADSLSNVIESFQPVIVDGEIADTSFTRQKTYSDSLFTVTGTANFVSGEIFLDLDLAQNRPIDFTVTDVQIGPTVNIFIRSEDFEELNMQSFHTYSQPRLQWYHWMGIGAGVAAGTYIGLNIVF